MKYWTTAYACLICQMLGTGLIGVYGFFVEPAKAYFKTSVATIGFGPALLIFCSSIISPFLGWLLDRVAIKKVMLSGVVLLGGALLLISRTDMLWLVAWLFVIFSIGLILYGPLTCNTLLIKSYQQHLPRALGISAIGTSFSTIFLPPVIAFMMLSMSWQNTLFTIGTFVLVILTIVILVFIHQPEKKTTGESGESLSSEPDISSAAQGKSFRNKPFWFIGIGFAFLLSIGIVSSFGFIPHVIRLGYERADAAWLMSLMGTAGLIGKIGFAVLSDKMRPVIKWVIAAVIGCGVTGWFVVGYADNFGSLLIGAAFIGMSLGVSIPLHPFMNSLYFDQSIIGQVTGQQMPLFLPVGLAAAPLTGWSFDLTGSYSLAFIGAGVCVLIALVLLLNLPRYETARV